MRITYHLPPYFPDCLYPLTCRTQVSQGEVAAGDSHLSARRLERVRDRRAILQLRAPTYRHRTLSRLLLRLTGLPRLTTLLERSLGL
jgi:hypothetical protein